MSSSRNQTKASKQAKEMKKKMTPEFFTVFLPQLCSRRLRICPSFTKAHLVREVEREAVIMRTATDKKWKVELVKVGRNFFFKKGWAQFVADNDITIGEFLVFQYHGKSRFSVNLFGTDCVLKVTPENDDDTAQECDDMSVLRDTRGRPCEAVEGNKAVFAANEFMSKLKHPSFMVCMTKACINFKTIHLPNDFMRQHMREPNCGEIVSLELEMSENTWRVNLWSCGNKKAGKIYYRLGSGFADFVEDNEVERGDVCVFEAVNWPASKFRVFILRSDHQ